jgi:predicted peptidase
VFRLLTAAALVSLTACAGTNVSPRALELEPLSGAEAAEVSRRVEALSEAVPVETYAASVFQASNGLTLPYRLLRPDGVATGRAWPLVVILHGSGAIGDDNRAQVGPLARSWATDDARKRFPAFVLVPQFPARSANYKAGANGLPYSEGTALLAAAVELVHHVRATEHVAKDETYAMGFSMGGSALWNVLRDQPGLFARAAIVAGVPTADAARTAGNTRLLLVHGDADTENPFAAAWNIFVASKGGIEFWRYRGLAHEFPQDLIVTGRLRDWLFAAAR